MRLPFKIASRFLLSNKGQTILISLGISIGVAVQIFIGSLITGLQDSLIEKTVGNSPQITISGQDKYFELDRAYLRNIKNYDAGILEVSYSLDVPGLITRDKKSNSILLRGFDLSGSDRIYNLKNKIFQGKLAWGDKINIGKELAKELELKVGDKISILTSDGKRKEFIVAGIFDFKVANINKNWIILNLSTLQEFTGLDKISAIEIKVDDVFKADTISEKIKSQIDSDKYKITNWKEENQELLSGLNGQSVSSIMIQFFVIVAVVLGIASVLAISVLQKSKQIGILKAMGIKNKQASYIFLFQGLILGIIGGILGILFGLGLLISFSKFAINSDGSPVVPVSISYSFILFSAILAIISSGLASLIPAIKSSKLDPIEVIKNG